MTARAQAAYVAREKARDPIGFSRRKTAKNTRFHQAHPEKRAAWQAVYRATRSGRLVRPGACERCGKPCKPEASHDDYSRQLEVEWLCRQCHSDKDNQKVGA